MSTSLLLWRHLPADEAAFLARAKEGNRTTDNSERLDMGGHKAASFAKMASGVLHPRTVVHDHALLSKLASLGAPGAELELAQVVGVQGMPQVDQLVNDVKLAGFVQVSQSEEIACSQTERQEMTDKLGLPPDLNNAFQVIRLTAKMPSYQQGSSRLLSFAKQVIDLIAAQSSHHCYQTYQVIIINVLL